jgi:hypothetical protein
VVSLNASYLSFALTLMAQHAERVMGDPYLARELFAAVLELSAPHHDKAAAAAQPLKVRSETEWGAKGERERNRERERERERESPPPSRPRVKGLQRRKSRVKSWRGFGWEIAHTTVSPRRPPIKLYAIVARTHMYTCAANVWELSIVQGPFSVAPCERFFTARPPKGRLEPH